MDFSFPGGVGSGVRLAQVYTWSAEEKLEGPDVSWNFCVVHLGSEILEGSQWDQGLLELPVSYLSQLQIPVL